MALLDASWRLDRDLVLVEAYGAYRGPDDGRQVPDAVAAFGGGADGLRLVGALVVPDDEVVFYLIAATSVESVRRAADAAGLQVIRIVPAAWAAPVAASANARRVLGSGEQPG